MFASLEKFLLTTVTSVLKADMGRKANLEGQKKSLLQICLPFPPGHLESCHNCHLHWCHLKGKGEKKKLDLSLMLGSKGKGYFSVTDQFSFKHWFCYALTSVVR